MKERDISVETYRVFLTFMICLIHAVSFGIWSTPWASGALSFSVCGFVFISGWFGIHFSVSKMVRLLALGLIMGTLAYLAGRTAGFAYNTEQTVDIICRMWFLCAYLVLMLIAPILNVAVRHLSEDRCGIFGGGAMLVVWNWLATFSFGRTYLPMTAGLGSYTFTMMLSVYVLARCLRMATDSHSIRTCFPGMISLTIGFIGLLALCGVGWRFYLGCYASPFAIAAAAIGFFLFRRMPVCGKWTRLITWLAPSTFPIILLHSNIPGAKFINIFERWMSHYCPTAVAVVFITAIVIFVTCGIVDILRRLVLVVIKDKISVACIRVDRAYERFINRILPN